MITRASLKSVSEMSPGSGACISIICPLNLPGEPARDDLRTANLFRQAEERLQEWPATQDQLRIALEEVSHKRREPKPRRYSVAAYIKPGWSHVELVPELLTPSVTMSSNFLIRPLLPLVPMMDQTFHVLALTETTYRLFECDASFIEEKLAGSASKVEEPLRMELQSHSVGTSAGGARPASVFHVGGYEPKEQITRFFAEVDREVSDERRNTEVPLILVTTERMASLYRGMSQCTNILAAAVIKDPAYLSPSDLHEATLPVVQEYTESREKEFLKSPEAEPAKNIYDTIQFASQGRVHTLFVANEPELWGAFDKATGNIEVHSEQMNMSEDLLNVAALLTVSRGGIAIGVPQRDIPENRMTYAKYRY